MELPPGLPAPSPHALALAGVALAEGAPPFVAALAAEEVVVVVSRSRNPAREVRLDACRRDGVPVVQRPSGGGAVVLAPGVAVASALHAAAPDRLLPDRYFAHFCAAMEAALAACGVAGAARRGTSDLALGDRKVAGTSLRLWRGRVLFQASVLVDPDLSLLDRYLGEPSLAPAYRAGRRHGDFVTSLAAAGHRVTAAAVAAAMAAALLRPPALQAPRAAPLAPGALR
jgi:lipoate-protein ligase A